MNAKDKLIIDLMELYQDMQEKLAMITLKNMPILKKLKPKGE